LLEDHEKFAAQGAVILATGPDGVEEFRDAAARGVLPFRGIPDPDHRIANLFGQRWKLLGWGRQPSVVVIDREGRMRWRSDGDQMWQIPPNDRVLAEIEAMTDDR
jgi:peroxiredoxin